MKLYERIDIYMFIVDLPVPESCYKCPMCDYEQGHCLLSELDEETSFSACNYSNVIMFATDWKGDIKKNIDYEQIAAQAEVTVNEVKAIIESGGKHPNCPIHELTAGIDLARKD